MNIQRLIALVILVTPTYLVAQNKYISLADADRFGIKIQEVFELADQWQYFIFDFKDFNRCTVDVVGLTLVDESDNQISRILLHEVSSKAYGVEITNKYLEKSTLRVNCVWETATEDIQAYTVMLRHLYSD